MNISSQGPQLHLNSGVGGNGNIRSPNGDRTRLNAEGYQLLRIPTAGNTQQRNRGYDQGANGVDSLNGDLQDFAATNTIFSNFIYFNQRLYVGVGQSPIYAYAFNPGTANTAGFFDTTPAMSTTATFPGRYSFSPQPVISANGSGNAVLWAIDFSGANDILYAFDANALSNQLYASSTNSSDQGPPSVKFSVPVVANGRVYVAGQGLVAVYGLLAK